MASNNPACQEDEIAYS